MDEGDLAASALATLCNAVSTAITAAPRYSPPGPAARTRCTELAPKALESPDR